MLRLHYLRSWFESEWVRVLTFAVWRTCTSLSLWRTLALTSSFPPFINLLTRNHMVLVGRHMHPHSRCPQDFNEGHRRSHLFHVQIRVVWPVFVRPHVSFGTSFPLVCVNRNQKPGGGGESAGSWSVTVWKVYLLLRPLQKTHEPLKWQLMAAGNTWSVLVIMGSSPLVIKDRSLSWRNMGPPHEFSGNTTIWGVQVNRWMIDGRDALVCGISAQKQKSSILSVYLLVRKHLDEVQV